MSGHECPVCHHPMMGPNEVCSGSFTDRDHPSAVKAVPVQRCEGEGTIPTDDPHLLQAGVTREFCPGCPDCKEGEGS